eukprot:s563_g21.t1
MLTVCSVSWGLDMLGLCRKTRVPEIRNSRPSGPGRNYGQPMAAQLIHPQQVVMFHHVPLPCKSPGIPTACLRVLKSRCCQCQNNCQDRRLQ